MIRLKKAILIFAISSGAAASAFANEIGSKTEKNSKGHVDQNFPKIVSVRGAPTNDAVPVHLHQVLMERGLLETNENSRLGLALSPDSELIVEPGSEVELPVITWGEGVVLEIRLKKGRLFFACEKNCHQAIWTPLSRQTFGNGQLWLEFKSSSPSVQLFVLHGTHDFNGLENEQVVSVGPGKKVAFQGVKEDGEVAYDHLLHGKLIARGQLEPVTDISKDELAALEKELVADKKAKVIPPKPTPPPGAICQNPWGAFNQCHWSPADSAGRCVRRRCNASGEWAEPETVTRCSGKAQLKACDF